MPIIILGGSDRKPVVLPRKGRDKHPLSGYKGVDVRIGHRPLILEIVDRVRASDCFEPVYVAGPERIYGSLARSFALIDTDGGFGRNIERSLEDVRVRHPGLPVGFLTCDVLPEPGTLRGLLDDYWQAAPCDMWFPLVRAPEDRSRLGPSAWKPSYRIPPEEGAPPVRVLPGHLVLVDPDAMRRRFVYRLFELGYRTRNRAIGQRRAVMVRGVLLTLLLHDLLHLVRLRAPNLTWSVLRAGLTTARALRAGRASRQQLERALRRIFVTRRHRRAHPERRILLPIVDALSLALDIDTEEEALELGGELGNSTG